MYRAALDHYLTEYDRATDIHSALWQEVYTKPAPASAPADPAPPNPTPALAFHQPTTGVPLFKPFYTQPGRVQIASRDPVVQLFFNRDGSGRAEPSRVAEKPSSDSRPHFEKRKQDRHGAHGQRAIGEEPRLRNQTPAPIGTPRKGTYFFGGAGMDRAYIDDFVTAFKEAGVQHARAVNSEIWSINGPIDALSVAVEMDRDLELTGNADFGVEGEQFNLVGFSYGGTQAAQFAADYADRGGKIDHLVLIGTPISQKFLDALENHPNIGTVIVKDLPGDPVRAGMDFWELPGAAATFLGQERRGETGVDGVPGQGHFHYSGDDPESARRRRELVKKLVEAGFK